MKVDIAIGVVVDFGGVVGQGQSGLGNSSGDVGCLDCDTDYCGNGHHHSACDSDYGGGCDSDLSDSDCSITALDRVKEQLSLWFGRVALTIQLMILSTIFAFAHGTEKISRGIQFAFYIGPTVSFGPLYFTCGACIGQFGCFAVGGGIQFGGWGIGILIPIWPWWI